MTGGEGGASERGVSFFLLKSEGLKSPGAERSKDQRGVGAARGDVEEGNPKKARKGKELFRFQINSDVSAFGGEGGTRLLKFLS